MKTYGLEQQQRAVFLAANREYLARNMSLARALGFFHPLVAMIAGLGTLVVLWAGGRRIIGGECTLGTLVAFMALFGLMTWPTIALGWVVSLFQRGFRGDGPDRRDPRGPGGRRRPATTPSIPRRRPAARPSRCAGCPSPTRGAPSRRCAR